MTTYRSSSLSTVESLPTPYAPSLPEGSFHGVHFTLPAEHRDWLLAKIERWFATRAEVILVDTGVTAKDERGYIILEWEGVQIDPLFLAILHEDDLIDDYSVYLRDAQPEEAEED